MHSPAEIYGVSPLSTALTIEIRARTLQLAASHTARESRDFAPIE
jgi:hypothetical protein